MFNLKLGEIVIFIQEQKFRLEFLKSLIGIEKFEVYLYCKVVDCVEGFYKVIKELIKLLKVFMKMEFIELYWDLQVCFIEKF